MAVEVGAAYISVRPSLVGFQTTLNRELRKMAPPLVSIGREWGAQLQRGIKEKLNPIEVRLDAGQVAQRLVTLNRALDRIDGRRINIGVDADVTAVAGRLAAFEQSLARLDGRTVNLRIDVDMGGAVAEVLALEQVLARMDGRRINIQFDADVFAAMSQTLLLNRELSQVDGRRAHASVDVDIGGALASLFTLKAAMLGVGAAGAPQIAAIGAGLIGLAGPLAAAAAGFGGLAAVAMPAIMNVSKALQQETQASQASGAAAGTAAAQASAAASARQQLAAAVRNAADSHRQALEQVRQAELQVAQAQASARRAQEDLTRARQQARRQIQDLANNLADARLSERQGVFDVADAEKELARLRADPKATKDQIARQRLAVDQAKQQLNEQRLTLQRLTADEKAARKAGVDGSNQVKTARDRLAEANARITESERALSNARANVARADRQSADQIAAARRALVQATTQASAATGGLGKQLVKLTPLEQQLATAWKGLTSAFNEWARALQPAVLPLLIKSIGLLRGLLPTLTPIVYSAAKAVGGLLDQLSAGMKSPFFQQFAADIARWAGPAITLLGQIVGNLLKAFAGIASAFAPIGFAFLGVINKLTAAFAQFTVGLTSNPAFQRFAALMIQVLDNIVAGAAQIAPQILPILGTVFGVLLKVGLAFQDAFRPLVSSALPALNVLVSALAKVVPAVLPVVTIVAEFAAALLTGLLPTLAPVIDALKVMAVQIAGSLVIALRQSAPALQQLVTSVATLLPELLPLVGLFAKLAVTVLPVVPALLSIAATIIGFLVPVIRIGIQLVTWWWTTIANLIIPVFRVLVSVVTWVAGVLAPALHGIGAAVMWLWTNAFAPAFRGIVTLARWLYTIIAVVVIAPLLIAFKVLGAVVRWLWSNVVKPAFTLIGSLIRGVYNTFIKPVLDAFRRVIREYLAPTVQWLWTSVIRPVWGWIGGHVRSVYNTLIKPTIDKFKSVIGSLSGAFKTAVEAIGRQWDKLKDVAKKPVAFVVNTVFNSGIVKIWNAVAKLVPGVKTLSPIQGFASGGVVQSGAYGVLPGYAPGRDTMLAAVSPGEAWIRPDATRALGSSFIYGLNAAAASGGTSAAARFLAEQGAPQFGLGGIVGGFLKSAKDLFTGGLVKTATKAFNPLLDIADRAVGGTAFGDLAVGTARGMVGQILSYFKPLESKIGGDGRKVVKVAEKYVGLSGNPNKFTQRMGMNGLPWCGMFVDGVFDEASAGKALKGVGNPAAVWSYRALPSVPQGAKRAGDLGLYRGDAGHINIYTGKGAITIGGNESNSVRRQSGYINSASSIRRPRFGLGGIVPTILAQDREENRRSTTPLATQLLRGIAGQPLLFDDGGWLPPGLTTVLNNTGRPEAVLPPGALRAIVDGRSGGAARSVSVMDNATVIVQDPVDIDLLTQRQEFAVRAATFGE